MAKSQTNAATSGAQSLISQAQSQTQPFIQGFGNLENTYNQQANGSYGAASSGFTNQQQTGGYSPSQAAMLTGGYSGIASGGGYSPSALNTLNSGYGSLAANGGFNPTQANQFIEQATEGTGTTYSALEQQAKQNLVKTGGLGGGGGLSQMARQLSQAQGQNTLNAEVGLNQLQTQNKLAGLQGFGNTQQNLVNNQLGALQGFGNFAGNQAANINAGNVGQANLYGTSAGAGLAAGNSSLAALGLDFSSQQSAINSLVNLSKNPGAFQTGLSDLYGGAGAAAGILGAL